jgi:hypothetical protein
VRGYGRSETEAVHNLDSPLASGTQRPVHNRVQLEKEYAPFVPSGLPRHKAAQTSARPLLIGTVKT